ncbi:MAG: nucleotide exchange factor GrpE [Spirochaetota bacterium]|nr:nucleotide exchange factor GrpE [Spirochaetota bacterium]
MTQENHNKEEIQEEDLQQVASDTVENIEDIVKDAIEEMNDDAVAILEKENQSLKDSYLRLSAETDNYRKRIQQEKENFKKIALKDVVEKLLPVVDNLERSIQASSNSDNIESLREGINMVLNQFEGVLKDIGLETIEISKGDEFDPQYCEAVMIEERDDIAHSMTIVDVFEAGRRLSGQVIRTAKVKVAKKSN